MKSKILSSGLMMLTVALTLSMAQADTLTTVRTPRNTIVNGIIRTDVSAAENASITQQFRAAYPQATYVATATRRYNCHSFAWHSQNSATNTVWINTPEEDKYWTDGSYTRITSVNGQLAMPSTATVPIGSKVSWGNNDHSAIRQTSTQVRSKWGPAPLFDHKPNYSPYSCADMQCSFTLNYYKRS